MRGVTRLRRYAFRLRRSLEVWVSHHLNVTDPYVPPTGQLPATEHDKPYLWLTWTGRNEMPAYLQLCIDSVRRHNGDDFEVVLVTPENLHTYLSDLHPGYELLSYPHRADYLQCRLLNEHGGVYLDVDTLCFRSLRPFLELVRLYDVVSYDASVWGGVVGISAFGPTRHHSTFTTEWARALEAVMDRRYEDLVAFRREHEDPRLDPLRWEEILAEIVGPLARRLRTQDRLSLYRVPLDYFPNVSELFTVEELCTPRTHARVTSSRVDETAYLLILNNALYPGGIKQMSPEAFLESDTGLAVLVSRALQSAPSRPS